MLGNINFAHAHNLHLEVVLLTSSIKCKIILSQCNAIDNYLISVMWNCHVDLQPFPSMPILDRIVSDKSNLHAELNYVNII